MPSRSLRVGVLSMVVAGKIFRLSESLSLSEIASKLENYHVEEVFSEGDYNFTLVTEVVGLVSKRNLLNGVYSHDYVIHVFHRGNSAPLPRTIEAVFSLTQLENATYLTVVEKKRIANLVANKLSQKLFEKTGGIVEARIPPETLKAFHLKNKEDTKITIFDNVDIPNVDKLSLYGPDIINTTLFEDYSNAGQCSCYLLNVPHTCSYPWATYIYAETNLAVSNSPCYIVGLRLFRSSTRYTCHFLDGRVAYRSDGSRIS
jgi:hypothetical protein